MKKTTSELRDLSREELARRLDDKKEEAFNLRFQNSSGQLEDTNRLRIIRRDIARIMTLIREAELEAEGGRVRPQKKGK